MRICVADAEGRKELTAVLDFLAAQPLDYPRYQEWVGRTEAELASGYKRAILATCDGKLAGDLVWHPHKALQGLAEWKNIRIHPEMRRRDFGRFLVRQAEVTCGFRGAVCDVRAHDKNTIDFLVRCGYSIAAIVPLYDSDQPDVVLVKLFDAEASSTLALGQKIETMLAAGRV